jgi:hypothetical protein
MLLILLSLSLPIRQPVFLSTPLIFSQGKFPTACGELNMNPEDTPLLAAGSFIPLIL